MATIVLTSEQVIEAANKTIARINAVRDKRDEASIQKAMQKRMFSFRRGFYRMEYEEAKAWFYEVSYPLGNWCRSYYAWGDLEKAKSLLRIAQYGDHVTLNEECVRVLFP